MPRIPSPSAALPARVDRTSATLESPKAASGEAPAKADESGFDGKGSLSVKDAPVTPALDAATSLWATRLMGAQGQPTTRPGVAELYARYGVSEPMGRPKERVLTWAAFIDERLRGADTPSALASRIIDTDLRRQLFLLEGILKVYKNGYEELRPARDDVKALEDAVGDVTHFDSQLRALEGKDNVPPEAREWIVGQRAEAEGALVKLVEERWSPNEDGEVPAIKDLIQALDGVFLGNEGANLRFLAKELRSELKDIRDTSYDMADLQGKNGMHALRRDLRWFAIFAEATDGLVQLSREQNPVKRYEPMLEHELASSKFVKLPPPDLDKQTITLSHSLYTALMEQVLGFGDLKDQREEIEGLAHALLAIGQAGDLDEAESKASQMLGRSRFADDGLTAKAEARYQEMSERGLVQALRKELKPYAQK